MFDHRLDSQLRLPANFFTLTEDDDLKFLVEVLNRNVELFITEVGVLPSTLLNLGFVVCALGRHDALGVHARDQIRVARQHSLRDRQLNIPSVFRHHFTPMYL